MSAVAIIPARGGSVRIPRKNLRDFRGKPIIAYSIETALKSGLFERVYVSTEDAEVAEVAVSYGAQVIRRPPELAEIGAPDCGTQEVMRHALRTLPPTDNACCVYPCAPMLRPETLLLAHALLVIDEHVDYVVPVGTWLRDPGQFYLGRSASFLSSVSLLGATRIMGIDPATECDINTEDDWTRAEQMYNALQEAK